MYDAVSTCPSALEPLESRFLLSAAPHEAILKPSPPIAEPVLSAIEQESIGGPANNELATAESLRFAWMLPYPSYQDGFGSQVAVVEGQADGLGGGTPFSQTCSVFGSISGTSVFSLAYGDMDGDGTWDAPAPAGEGSLTFTTKLDLAGATKYLTLWLEGTLLGNLFETDGASGATNTTQVSIAADVLSKAAADGMLKFTVRPSAAVTKVNSSFMMTLSYDRAGGGADFYRFDLQAGQSASLTVTGASPALAVQLVGTDGTVLSSGTAMDGQATIAGFQAVRAGTYYARVVGEGAYTLRAERSGLGGSAESGDALLDSLVGVGPASPNWKWAAGHLTAGDRDYFEFAAQKSATLAFQVFSFASPGSESKLVLDLYDAAGNRVATARGPHLKYEPPRDGLYYLQVTTTDGTAVDYTIGITVGKPKGKA